MIAILTPHAVRTGRGGQGSNGDESVCLDELAFARFSPPPTPIIPLLLIPCEPPFVIFRLNYLDFLRAGADEASCRAAFDALVRTVRAVKAGDAPTYRATSFEPLDFDLYLRTKTRDFCGTEVADRRCIRPSEGVRRAAGPPAGGLIRVGARRPLQAISSVPIRAVSFWLRISAGPTEQTASTRVASLKASLP
jgi:hypothetical protein